jgi:histidinol dehydrogenase
MIPLRKLRTTDFDFESRFRQITAAKEKSIADVESVVRPILQAVKEKGDAALFDYTSRYDRVQLDTGSVRLSPAEIESAAASLSADDLHALTQAAERIETFHRRQLQHRELSDDVHYEPVTEVSRPLQRVGLYIPGGKASYPSTVLMTAIPARVAGVKELIMVSPDASPHVLAAAHIAGVSHVFRVGGAQAVAALAYGTESIPRVDKIAGPGNRYVETAKRLLFGVVGLDMLAGPSEVLILADKTAIPAFAAADFIAQAEHDQDAVAIIISTCEQFLSEIEREIQAQLSQTQRREIAAAAIENNGLLIYTPVMERAVALANRIAPEHLELMVSAPHEVLRSITAAGAVFLGNFSPTAAGDYNAGPSHVLPTAGTARFFSPLGVSDFIRYMSVIELSERELNKLESGIRRLARIEGLDAHARAVEKRIQQ